MSQFHFGTLQSKLWCFLQTTVWQLGMGQKNWISQTFTQSNLLQLKMDQVCCNVFDAHIHCLILFSGQPSYYTYTFDDGFSVTGNNTYQRTVSQAGLHWVRISSHYSNANISTLLNFTVHEVITGIQVQINNLWWETRDNLPFEAYVATGSSISYGWVFGDGTSSAKQRICN